MLRYRIDGSTTAGLSTTEQSLPSVTVTAVQGTTKPTPRPRIDPYMVSVPMCSQRPDTVQSGLARQPRSNYRGSKNNKLKPGLANHFVMFHEYWTQNWVARRIKGNEDFDGLGKLNSIENPVCYI